jgi:hypothetical protein
MMKRYMCVRNCFSNSTYHQAGKQYQYPDTVKVSKYLEEIKPPKPAKKSVPKR